MSLLDFRGKMRSLRDFLLPGGDIFLPSFRRVHLKRFRQKDLSRKIRGRSGGRRGAVDDLLPRIFLPCAVFNAGFVPCRWRSRTTEKIARVSPVEWRILPILYAHCINTGQTATFRICCRVTYRAA